MKVCLQARDLEGLGLLMRFRCATAQQMNAYVYSGQGIKQTYRRLAELESAGYLSRDRYPGLPAVYRATQAGAEATGLGLKAVRPIPPAQVAHALAVLNAAQALLRHGGAWLTEREIRSQASRRAGRLAGNGRVPDGVWVLGGQKIAVELQRSREPAKYIQAASRKLLLRYDAVLWLASTPVLAAKAAQAPAAPGLLARAGAGHQRVYVMLVSDLLHGAAPPLPLIGNPSYSAPFLSRNCEKEAKRERA